MGLDYDFVKVLDFGLVKSSDQSSIETTLLTGAQTTIRHAGVHGARKSFSQGEVDQRADVYALGCVAYYMLTGQLVFEADTPMKMFVQHLQTPPIPPSQRTELPIPREVDELVMACLEKDPQRRPQNAGELLRMIERCRSGQTWDQGDGESLVGKAPGRADRTALHDRTA